MDHFWGGRPTGLPQEDDDAASASQKPPKSGSPTKISFESLTKEEQSIARECAAKVQAMYSDTIPKDKSNMDASAYLERFKIQTQENENVFIGAWGQLPSQIRTSIKKYQDSKKAQQ